MSATSELIERKIVKIDTLSGSMIDMMFPTEYVINSGTMLPVDKSGGLVVYSMCSQPGVHIAATDHVDDQHHCVWIPCDGCHEIQRCPSLQPEIYDVVKC